MGKRTRVQTQAVIDQIKAVLRDSDGFPVGTGDIARRLGGRLVTYRWAKPPPEALPRPDCWPEDMPDEENRERAWCEKCSRSHRMPVFRYYDAQDIRHILKRLERQGEIESFLMEAPRRYYWRAR